MTERLELDRRDIVAHLAATDLFSVLEPDALTAIASVFAASRMRPGRLVTRAGDVDATLWVVVEGMVAIDRRAPDGTLEELAFGGYGTVVGEDGVFAGEARRTNVVTVEPTVLLHAEREALWHLVATQPDLMDRLVLADRVRRKIQLSDAAAAVEGEFQVGLYRRHWLALAGGMLAPLALLVGALVVGSGLSMVSTVLDRAAPLAVLLLAFLGLGVPIAGFVWAFFDYRNDCLIVTNRRVIHVEKKPLIDERRCEAPLARIQDVRVVTPNPIARVLGFGTITVQTAASHGAIQFTIVPRPERVRQTIFAQVDRARDEERRERQSWIAAQVRQAIGYGEPIGGESVADAAPGVPAPSPGRAAARLAVRFLLYFWPKMRLEEGDRITWRKHWWFLVRQTAAPLLFLGGSSVGALWWWYAVGAVAWLVVLAAWCVLGLWLLWGYENWRNDLYQLTNEHVIDIERLPLGLFEERRQASLAQVQDLRYVVPHPWATLLNYGSVVIQTAAESGDFTFDNVYNPTGVHEEIVARIDAYRARHRQDEEEQRAREWARWLAAYHGIVFPRDAGAPRPDGEAAP